MKRHTKYLDATCMKSTIPAHLQHVQHALPPVQTSSVHGHDLGADVPQEEGELNKVQHTHDPKGIVPNVHKWHVGRGHHSTPGV